MPRSQDRLILTADLSTKLKTLKLAEALAEKLAKTSKPGSTVIVTDENGNEIYTIAVPSKSSKGRLKFEDLFGTEIIPQPFSLFREYGVRRGRPRPKSMSGTPSHACGWQSAHKTAAAGRDCLRWRKPGSGWLNR
jgi:hypothetical protein